MCSLCCLSGSSSATSTTLLGCVMTVSSKNRSLECSETSTPGWWADWARGLRDQRGLAGRVSVGGLSACALASGISNFRRWNHVMWMWVGRRGLCLITYEGSTQIPTTDEFRCYLARLTEVPWNSCSVENARLPLERRGGM